MKLFIAAIFFACFIITFGAKLKIEPTVQPIKLGGYVFIYFTGNTIEGEKIYIAASQGNDALNWVDLNGGKPILSSSQGTRGLRDPHIIRSHTGDKFYLIATDLSMGSGISWDEAFRQGSPYLEIWESKDLINWSEQRHVLVSPPTAGNTWAPEAFYDDSLGKYLVYWSSSLYSEGDTNHTGQSYNRLFYATTEDFVTFGEPQLWQDTGRGRIDSNVLKDGDVYYRFTKDESTVDGCIYNVFQESSTNLTAPVTAWEQDAICIGKKAGTGAIEGPTSFKSNPGDVHGEKYYLFVDEYAGRGYIPLETVDIANPAWKVSSTYKLPTKSRHGTVMPITAEELARITSKYSSQHRRHNNPVLEGYYADPNIVVFGSDYYIYATTDGFEGWGSKEFYIWKSKDLVSWTRGEKPFLNLDTKTGNVPWANGNAWAPTIIDRGGKYYFYFSGNNAVSNIKTIGVAVSESPEGPFVAQSQAMILNTEAVKSGQAIDPAAFFDPETSKYYLFWGNGRPLYAELNEDMVSINWDTAVELNGLVNFREGLFVNYRKGLYHLTYSIDDTGSKNYRVGYATSTSVHGPWGYRGVVLEKDSTQEIFATGHNSILQIPCTDEWYIAYHRFHIPNGDGTHREVAIDKLTVDESAGFIVPVKPTWEGPEPRKNSSNATCDGDGESRTLIT